MQDWVGFCVDDLAPATGKTIESMEKFPGSGEPSEAGFCIANDTVGKEPMFVTMGKVSSFFQIYDSSTSLHPRFFETVLGVGEDPAPNFFFHF